MLNVQGTEVHVSLLFVNCMYISYINDMVINISLNTHACVSFQRAMVKHYAADVGSIPGLGRSPGGGNATSSNVLPWKIPWTEEPGGLQSLGSQSSTRLRTQGTQPGARVHPRSELRCLGLLSHLHTPPLPTFCGPSFPKRLFGRGQLKSPWNLGQSFLLFSC